MLDVCFIGEEYSTEKSAAMTIWKEAYKHVSFEQLISYLILMSRVNFRAMDETIT